MNEIDAVHAAKVAAYEKAFEAAYRATRTRPRAELLAEALATSKVALFLDDEPTTVLRHMVAKAAVGEHPDDARARWEMRRARAVAAAKARG